MDLRLNFWRTALPMILLAAIILWNWPTGPLDFGSQSPWSGLVLEIDTGLLENPPLLLIASLPAKDENQQRCSLIVGTAIWTGNAITPLLLDGETDALRLQKIQLEDETPVLYRTTRGKLGASLLPDDINIDELIGGILHNQKVILPWSSHSTDRPDVQLSKELFTVTFEIHHDDQNQKRWRSERGDFQQLWEQAQQENPEQLAPFRHGKVVIGATSKNSSPSPKITAKD